MRTLARKPVAPGVVLPRFELVDLRLFINVAAAKSFALGADSSALSAAAASMRVKHLEDAMERRSSTGASAARR